MAKRLFVFCFVCLNLRRKVLQYLCGSFKNGLLRRIQKAAGTSSHILKLVKSVFWKMWPCEVWSCWNCNWWLCFAYSQGPFSTIGRKEQRRCLQNSLLGTKRNRRLLSKTYEESLLIKQHSEKGGIAFTRMYCQENLKVTKILKSTYPQEETAVVYGAECQQGSFALKRFTTGATYAHWKELDLLRQLRSPRILPIYGAFCEGFPHLVTELCYGNYWCY